MLSIVVGPKGGRTLLMSPTPLYGISRLSFDSIFLSSLLLFCLVLLLILSSQFVFLLLVQSPTYFPEISSNFFLEIVFVGIALVFSWVFF